MRIYINKDMMPDDMKDDGMIPKQEGKTYVAPDDLVGETEDSIINQVNASVRKERRPPMSGRERFLALCKRMGLHPEEAGKKHKG